MWTSRNLPAYSILFLYLSVFATAWPWPRWLPELDTLIVRDSGNTTAAETTSESTTESSTPTKTSGSSSASSTGSNTSKSTGKSSSKTTSATSRTSYSATYAAGGVNLITPASSLGEQYYKIGTYVTFVWNYTSLEGSPTAVNVMATCTANSQLYTIQANQTVKAGNATGAVIWDTGAYQATAVQNPLLSETYTLLIYDVDSSVSTVASPGYLSPYDSYTFGMYTPQPYVPYDQWQCATCSGAISDMQRRAVGMVLGTCALTVLSFTWFVGGLGVIW